MANGEDATQPLLLHRIEAVMHHLVDDCLDQGQDLKLSLCRSNSNTSNKITKRFRNPSQARSLTSIVLVLAYCHTLYPRTATTREVYYYYITHFKSQRECDLAIADAACVLGNLPRHRLGLHASSRGWYAGPGITIVKPTTIATTTTATNALEESSSQASSSWEPRPITADWLRHYPMLVQVSSVVRCILIVEKEGIFQRLVEDGGIPGCIIVTGKGFPDLATRALVWTIHHRMPDLPIYGLADCDPFGVSVLHTYGKPPVNDPDTDLTDIPDNHDHYDDFAEDNIGRGKLPLQWLGLRPSQWKQLDFPDAVFQTVTSRDQQQLESLLCETHPFCDNGMEPLVRAAELETMMETKVELEALHWLGMEFCTEFVTQLIEYNLTHNTRTRTDTFASSTDSNSSIDDNNTGWMQAI